MRKRALPPGKKRSERFFFERPSFRLWMLFAAAVLISLLMTGGRAVAEVLFQSPASPVQQQQQQPANKNNQQPQQPANKNNQQPQQPANNQQQSQQNSQNQPQPAPTEPAQPQAVESQSPVAAPAADSPAQPAAESRPPAPQPQPYQPVTKEQAPESRNLILDQAEFIDTVVVSVAYLWLCCGIVLILAIPLAFLFLHIRGRSKIIKEEQL